MPKTLPFRAPALLPANALAVNPALAADDALFCFSAATLKAKLEEFRKGFPGEVSFAVKSNPAAEILSTLAAGGLTHWDVASVKEMTAVSTVSTAPVFHYHNPVKSRREIAEAYRTYGCRRFAVDCREELAKIGDVAGGDVSVEIAVRFVLPRERTAAAHDFSTKFGAPEHICIELLKDAAARGFKPMLTFHPGSQSREPQTYVRHIEAAARIAGAAGVSLARLNVGGGFPASYPLSRPAPLAAFFTAIAEATTRTFGKGHEPRLECEPGRGLVATCMSLLCSVKLVCTDGDDIFINDGIYGGLMECMQVPELMPPYRVIRAGKVLSGPTKSWKVFGPTCDPLDVLPHRLDLPASLREDDLIEFGTLGAYGLATTTRFNGYGGHQVLAVGEVYNG
ncbi:MAG: type III PLP-dependent enzyme [Rhizobiales bacterium]|nr:type III PLP-dependent enzyme [Hyphomicrobiales bacterium]MBI3673293.1 type III PLP-dependent enzyme [Hyphomicrobiales bacterium]